MDAIALLLLFVLWVAISGVVVVKGTGRLVPAAAPWRVRAGVGGLLALLMFLIPAGDDLWGRFRVSQLCETEGGVNIFKTVENVEGFQMPGSGDAILHETKYRFVESTWVVVFNGELIEGPARFSMGPTGKVVVEKKFVPKAIYAYRKQDEKLAARITKHEELIVDIQKNEILARQIYFNFPGGWFLSWISGGYGGGPGAGCQFTYVPPLKFLLSVLKPND
jgi:hypothetical protein